MNTTILLQGYLTKKRLGAIENEMARYVEDGDILCLPIFVITSEGGDTEETLAFLTRIERYGGFNAKIYRAESTAALIALSAMEREMVRDGIFIVDLGSAEIDSGTLITPEKVSAHIIEQAKKWRDAVFSALGEYDFSQKDYLMKKLIAQNRLALTPEECLGLGIVQRVI